MVFSVLAVAVLLLLTAWGNATVMLAGSAVMLVVGLFVFRQHSARTALLVGLAALGVAAVVAMLLYFTTAGPAALPDAPNLNTRE